MIIKIYQMAIKNLKRKEKYKFITIIFCLSKKINIIILEYILSFFINYINNN